MSKKRLFLLDGHALVYRAHYAFISRPLFNSKGQNTSAINGFVRYLWDVIKNHKPTHLAVSFDLEGPTFRNEIFPEYKAHRDAQPEDITLALPYIKRIIEAFNVPVVSHEGFEADDVIGTLAKKAEKKGFEVFLVTPDKDYAQLVSPNIHLFRPGRSGNDDEILSEQDVLKEWEIREIPQVVDMLGLTGDKVDNIPGIPGVGPKTAAKWLEQYGSLEGVIEHAEELSARHQELIRQYADQAKLSKTLATIDIDVPVKLDEEALEINEFNKPEIAEIFKELEFRNLAKTILGEDISGEAQKDLFGNPVESKGSSRNPERGDQTVLARIAEKNIQNTPHTYHLAASREAQRELAELLRKQRHLCFDTETTHIDPNLASLVGLSFAFHPHEAWYVPVPEDEDACKATLEIFRPVFEDPGIQKTGQNLKYDMLVLKWHGIQVKGSLNDTMLMHYLLEPDLRHNMDYLAETYLGYAPVPIENLIGKRGGSQLSMRQVPVEQVKEYAAEDADITWQLDQFLYPKLKQEKLLDLYDAIEEPLVRVLVEMEFTGVKIDEKYLARYSRELEGKIAALEKKIYADAGSRFNISSPRQVGEILYEKMKIPYGGKKTKSGQYSTDEDTLLDLAAKYPFVEEILKHRGLSKLKSTYVDALPPLINPRDGRIHSSFNQALAATGRLSSNNPNLQNIPIRTEEGRLVREAFIPADKDHLILSADYSQIELRIIAAISGDQAMIEAFRLEQDIHRATAARVYGVPYEKVSAEQRRNAKTVNFSIIYGAGSTNLSRQLSIPRAEAKELIDAYFAQYTGLKAYMQETVEKARKHGYVETLSGRRRLLRDIDSRNNMARAAAERIAINTPIQGTAADMIKIAMIHIQQDLEKHHMRSRMILQVHDELVFDAHRAEVRDLEEIVVNRMKHAIPHLAVPIEVGVGTGENWLEAH